MPKTVIERRQFLTGLAVAPLAASCAQPQASPPQTPASQTADTWERVRAEFALSPQWIHLAGFLLASHPRRVRDAIESHRRALDDNPALVVEQRGDSGPILKPAAAYLGVQPESIALTDSTTMGLALLYHGLPLTAADEVLTTTHDHYSTHESLRLATARAGATLRKVPLYARASEATVEAMAHAIELSLTAATRIVAITWVHSSTGVKTPVRAIAEVIARANTNRPPERRVWLCVDGVHGLGIENTSMPELGSDFFVAGTHKWLFGPRGTGIIWGKPELWPSLRPTIPAFGMAPYLAWLQGKEPPPTSAEVMTPGGFHSFEHRWALGEAFAFHLELGKAAVEARIHELNRQCKAGLAAMKHVTLHTPLDAAVSSGIVTFEVAGLPPAEVVKRLHAKHIVASTTPYAPSYARLAPGLLNTPAEVDAALREIRALG